jgi:hypothetical protein
MLDHMQHPNLLGQLHLLSKATGTSQPLSGKPLIPDKDLSLKIGPEPVCINIFYCTTGDQGFSPARGLIRNLNSQSNPFLTHSA